MATKKAAKKAPKKAVKKSAPKKVASKKIVKKAPAKKAAKTTKKAPARELLLTPAMLTDVQIPKFLFCDHEDGNLYVTHTQIPRFTALLEESETGEHVDFTLEDTLWTDDPTAYAKSIKMDMATAMGEIAQSMGDHFEAWCDSMECDNSECDCGCSDHSENTPS